MTNRRSGLGRGLDALIPRNQPSVEEVDVDLIAPNPQQPRSVFDPESLTELAESIREHGVIQPLIVSRPQTPGSPPYQLIAGERRLLASRQAGLAKVPVIVKEANPQALLELALVENLQRQDLGALEEAAAFRRLADEFSLTQEQIAVRVGRSRSAVANSLRLLTLSEEIQASLARREINAGHARALLGIEDADERRAAWRRIVEGRLTVRDAESLAKGGGRLRSRRTAAKRRSADIEALEERLRASLGTKVDLTQGRSGGRVVIHYYSDEELEGIIERLS
ncbi:MAG TPA: ParB/RepB/Spo0J family partition protein [Dehalococcoidia bacterium]|nr:ParB/RepB/Spo0J family partition protein [Dehalococcoidia bacterium]